MQKIKYTVTEFHAPDGECCGSLADLILDAHMIPPCGLIPPFRVVAAVLRAGGGDGGMSPGCVWAPFELPEQDYWRVVEQLGSITPDDLKMRHRDPQITDEIRPDYDAPDTDDYQAWLQSLVHRGHLPGGPFRDTRR